MTEPVITSNLEHAKQSPLSPLSPGKRLGFSVAAVLLLLLVLELTAALSERTVFQLARAMPGPNPQARPEVARAFASKIAQERIRLGLPPLKEWHPVGLAPQQEKGGAGGARGWSLSITAPLAGDYRVNSDGLRGDEILPLIPGEIRILSVGDSSVFGDLVEESEIWSTIASERLSVRWNRAVRAVVGAIPGHSTDESRAMLARVGKKVEPTWLVIGNLWSDVYRRDQSPEILSDIPRYRANGVLRHLALYRVLHILLSPWLESVRVGFMVQQSDLGAVGRSGPAPRVGLERYIQNLSMMAEQGRALGAKVAFLCLPAPIDFEDVPIPETVREYRLAMRGVAERMNAPFLDGPALFKEKGATFGYFADQVHPAPEGHALLGERMAELLEPLGPPPVGASQYPVPRK